MDKNSPKKNVEVLYGQDSLLFQRKILKRRIKLLFACLIFILLLGVLIYFFKLQNTSPTEISSSKKQDRINKESASNIHKSFYESVTVKTGSGLSFAIPKQWTAKFNKNSIQKLSFEISDWKDWDIANRVNLPVNYVQIKIETYENKIKMNLSQAAEKLSNKYLNKQKQSNTNTNHLKFLVWKGKETFSTKPRDFKQFITIYNDEILLIRAYSPDILKYEKIVDNFAASVAIAKEKPLSQRFNPQIIISKLHLPFVQAQESSFPNLTYNELITMDEKKDDTFSQNDSKYNDLLAKGYVFEALQGQRLTTLADELGNGAFINSYLFNENGELLKGPRDTRIEFTAEYSGKYYLVITNRKNEALPFKVWVEDRNQTDYVIKIKDFQTGVELFLPNEKGLQYIPFEKFAFLIDFNKLSKIEDTNPQVYSQPGTIEQFNEKPFFPEDNASNLLKTTYYKMDDETIMIYPVNEIDHIVSFPNKAQLATVLTLDPTANYLYRTFTNFQDIAEYKPSVDKNVISPLGEQKMLVILFNWQNDSNNKPFTREEVYQRFFGETNSLSSYYKEYSFNKTLFTGEVTNWYTIPIDNTFNNQPSCATNNTILHQMVRDSGINIDNYSRLAYVHPYNSACTTGGSIGGNPSTSDFNGALSFYELVHEIGHNLGLGHAHALICGNKTIDRYSNCIVSHYGDITPMGVTTYHFNAFHKAALGWIPQANIREVTESGTYTLQALEAPSTDTQSIRIKKKDTNEYYYLEYRIPTGLDRDLSSSTNLTGGVSVRIGYYIPYVIFPYTYLYPEGYLLDSTPESANGLRDAALSDGSTFVDEINNIIVKQIGHVNDKATISIGFTP